MDERSVSKSARRGAVSRVAAVIAFAVFILVLLECSARVYLSVKDGIPFTASASRHIYRYYPAIESLPDDVARKRQPQSLRVLFLGASVLKNPLYDVGQFVESDLRHAPALKGRRIEVYNLAVEGHTSLDSYYKYLLATRRADFDYVFVYHGINDLRANNCPTEIFRTDYSHYAWYDEVNYYFQHEKFFRAGVYLPYFLHVASRRLSDRFTGRTYIPRERPRPEWYKYGSDIKTEVSFRRNLLRIGELAASRHSTFFISTFASYIPEGYSIEKFRAGAYGRKYVFPIEMWGTPEAVAKGLVVHNRVAVAVASKNGAALIDESARLSGDARNFIDICHLSPRGVSLLASGFADAIIKNEKNKTDIRE